MAYTNSNLVSYTKLSPNHSGQRTHSIDRITPHCVVGQLSCESICGCFSSPSRQASCNYGIGNDGRIALCVEEKNRSWCSSSNANDQRAVTIECASDVSEPYAMNNVVYDSLVKLCTDICKRNGKKKLLWLADKNKTLNYTPKSDEMVLTVHRWFANKSCPGNWLYARLGDLAAKVTADDFITKITSVSPGSKGAQLWQDNLDLIFQKDQQLIDYVQMICGLAAIGKVFVEALIIAYGDGRNGKSTFWNAISRVLGLYSGNISADTLTVGCRRNIKPEMAEVKGKRLLIAAEMQEGARLNDSTVKQLCSTDDVFAEKKYKDPFSFKPCHTLVLYTNHLPRVSASDDGIWRRLIVIPFNAKIEGKADIKNYGEYLYENAGESILAWIIEGAKKVIVLDYQIPVPDCVTKAIDEYRSQNDWFGHFLDEKCDVDESFKESSSALYQAYRNYSLDCNEYVRSTADFYFALEKAGFERLTLNRKRYFKGLKIHDDNGAEEDFLQ